VVDPLRSDVTRVFAAIKPAVRLRQAQARDQAQAAVLRITGELADPAARAARDAAAVLRNARRALPKVDGRRAGRLRRAANELSCTLRHTATVVTRTRSRLAGVMPDSASRGVSLHDPGAGPIRRGRLGHPTEFGYKAQVVDNDDGVIIDHTVAPGNPADAPQLAPAIAGITRRAGKPPRAVTADRGYGEARVETELHTLGVCTVAIPARTTRTDPPRRPAPTILPHPGQVAHRLCRAHRPPQPPIRLGPHHARRPGRRPHLARTRRLRPQPHQNQRAGRMNDTHAPDTTPTHQPPQMPGP
jgi:transposase, IS5 family